MRPTPAILYKYCHPQRRSILADRNLWFAHPAEFNDPFDVLPSVLIAAHVSGQIDSLQFLESFMDSEGKQAALAKWRRIALCCLSDTPNNPLMWAHYADSHRGFALGLATSELFTYQPARTMTLAPVRYSSHRPSEVSAHDLRQQEVLLTKSLDWHYEREWRLMRDERGGLFDLRRFVR